MRANRLTLETICEGAVQQAIDRALEAVGKNIADPGTDLQTILNFVGTVTAGTIKDYSDDGVSQQATVRSGPRGKENKIVPSPCTLRPIRTFTEVIQPASAFIFRMKEGSGDTVQAALFEADGGSWRIDAIDRIAEHLENELKDTGV